MFRLRNLFNHLQRGHSYDLTGLFCNPVDPILVDDTLSQEDFTGVQEIRKRYPIRQFLSFLRILEIPSQCRQLAGIRLSSSSILDCHTDITYAFFSPLTRANRKSLLSAVTYRIWPPMRFGNFCSRRTSESYTHTSRGPQATLSHARLLGYRSQGSCQNTVGACSCRLIKIAQRKSFPKAALSEPSSDILRKLSISKCGEKTDSSCF